MEITDKTLHIDETVNQLRSEAHDAVNKVANASIRAAEALSQKGGQVKKEERQLEEKCRNYLNKNPLTVLSLAITAGFLLSRLLGRP